MFSLSKFQEKLNLICVILSVAAYTGYRAFNAYKKSSSANIDTTQFTNLDYVQVSNNL